MNRYLKEEWVCVNERLWGLNVSCHAVSRTACSPTGFMYWSCLTSCTVTGPTTDAAVWACVFNHSDSVWRYWRAFDHYLFQCSLDVLANTFLSEHDQKTWSKLDLWLEFGVTLWCWAPGFLSKGKESDFALALSFSRPHRDRQRQTETHR